MIKLLVFQHLLLSIIFLFGKISRLFLVALMVVKVPTHQTAGGRVLFLIIEADSGIDTPWFVSEVLLKYSIS